MGKPWEKWEQHGKNMWLSPEIDGFFFFNDLFIG